MLIVCFFFFYSFRPLAGISALAECMDCPELKAAVEDFIQLHFTEVYKLDEFLQLDVTQLTYILHQDKLTVRAEAQVRIWPYWLSKSGPRGPSSSQVFHQAGWNQHPSPGIPLS